MIESILPHDRRNFVHKRVFNAAKGFVSSGFNPLTAATSFLAPVDRGEAPPPPLDGAREGLAESSDRPRPPQRLPPLAG